MKLVFDDRTSRIEDKEMDTFFVGFNSNLFLRESCYRCKYCGQERISDFTIADFWGVSAQRASDEQRRNGISVMLVNTSKAAGILQELNDTLHYERVDPTEVLPYNKAFTAPNARPDARDVFFINMKEHGFDKTVKRFNSRYYLKKKIRRLLETILPKRTFEKLEALRKRKG